MDTSDITEHDITQIFSKQPASGTFHVLAVSCAGLNYLQDLKRVFADSQLDLQHRRKAAHDWLTLEPRLYRYTRKNTPLSIYDAGYQEEIKTISVSVPSGLMLQTARLCAIVMPC